MELVAPRLGFDKFLGTPAPLTPAGLEVVVMGVASPPITALAPLAAGPLLDGLLATESEFNADKPPSV